MPKRKTLSRSSDSDEEIIEKTAVKRTRKARIVPKAKVDDGLKQPASDIPSDSAATSMKSKLERMLEVKENKSDTTKKAKTKKSGYSSLYLKSLKECKRPGDPAPKKTTAKKPPKVAVDLLTQKVTEFTELADQSPDVIKFISENSLTIGAHISVAKGVYNGLINAFKIKATSMAFFITQPRRWTTEKALSDEEVSIFNEGVKILGYKRENIVPHGNYLVNLGSPDQTIYDKSYACFETELKICEQLQLCWLNIHPGSAVKGMDKEKCLQQIAESINKAHSATSNVTVLLENMCKQGTTVGGDLSDLGSIISHVTDKTRVGVCFDTCHAMAAGYPLYYSVNAPLHCLFFDCDSSSDSFYKLGYWRYISL
ncbi:probable endonuclease 4 [Bolinopsis microptera]|uniref:probable endonuclease 4 n=1 Tax=Bolinopsis microptera TaxID=2820187 RepID=UPI003079F3F4